MKMNTKIRYGLRAMIEISKHDSMSGILQKEIAEEQDIPLKYLDTIISSLRNVGLIVNFSGKRSGYVLAKPSNEISVYDIYRAFEPELILVNCLFPGRECERLNVCPVKDYWYELSDHIIDHMRSTSLDQFSA